MSVIEFSQLKDNKEAILLDVRTKEEYIYANLEGKHIPLDELENRHDELDLSKTIFCLCHHGVRSSYAAQYLDSLGAQDTVNIEGGIDAYSKLVDPTIPQY